MHWLTWNSYKPGRSYINSLGSATETQRSLRVWEFSVKKEPPTLPGLEPSWSLQGSTRWIPIHVPHPKAVFLGTLWNNLAQKWLSLRTFKPCQELWEDQSFLGDLCFWDIIWKLAAILRICWSLLENIPNFLASIYYLLYACSPISISLFLDCRNKEISLFLGAIYVKNKTK